MTHSATELIFQTNVGENNSCDIEFDLLTKPKSEGGVAVTNVNIDTATLSLYDGASTPVLIVGDASAKLDDVDVKPKIDANGHFDYTITEDFNYIVATNPTPNSEDHHAVLTIKFTISGVTRQFQKNARITVENNSIT